MIRYSSYESFQTRKTLLPVHFQSPVLHLKNLLRLGFSMLVFRTIQDVFFCGIGLRGWDDTDNSWKQHAKFSANCGYLIREKGDEFIKRVQNYENLIKDPSKLKYGENDKVKNQENESSKSIRKLSEEEINLHVLSRLDLPENRILLNYGEKLGYNLSELKKVLETRLSLHNDDFQSIEELLKFLMKKN